MSSKYTFQVVQYGQAQAPMDLRVRQGRPVVVHAQAGMRFHLVDALTQIAPQRLRLERKGSDLMLVLPEGHPHAPDVVIKGYFSADDVALMGRGASGEWRTYDAAGANASVGIHAAYWPDGQAAVAILAPAPSLVGWFSGEKAWMLTGIGTLGLVAAVMGSGGKSTATTNAAGLDLIQRYAKREAGAQAPGVQDFSEAGVQGVDANNLAAINTALTSTPLNMADRSQVQTMVSAYVRILGEANGTQADASTQADPSLGDYQSIGVFLGSQLSNPHALHLLNDVVKGLNTESADNVTKLRAIATVVIKLMVIAADETPVAALTVDDLLLLGLSQTFLDAHSASANMSAITSAIRASVNDGSQFSGLSQLRSNIEAFHRVISEANGQMEDADVLKNPTTTDYAAIHADIGRAAQSDEALRLLNEVVGGLDGGQVDSVTEIQALAATLDALANLAQLPSGAPSNINLGAADLQRLGLTGFSSTGANNQAVADLFAVALRDAQPGEVDRLAELQAMATLQALRVWAMDSAVVKTATVPLAGDYERLGVTRTDAAGLPTTLTAADLTALNSYADQLQDTRLDSAAEVAQLGASLFRLLDEANGSSADVDPAVGPMPSDFISLGVQGHVGDPASPLHAAANSLLADAVSAKLTNQVDTPAELHRLALAVDRVLDVAAAGPASGLGLSDWTQLGITGVTANNAAGVADLVARTADDGSGANSLALLQGLVSLHTVRAWASDSAAIKAATTPTAEDYMRIGVVRGNATAGVNALSTSDASYLNGFADNLVDQRLDSVGEVQLMAQAVFRVLEEANGSAADANPADHLGAADFVALGLPGHVGSATGLLHPAATRLLAEVVSIKLAAQVDTPGELNALAASVNRVMDVASGAPTSLLMLGDLVSMDIAGASASSLSSMANLIQATVDHGGGVDSLAELQAIAQLATATGGLAVPVTGSGEKLQQLSETSRSFVFSSLWPTVTDWPNAEAAWVL